MPTPIPKQMLLAATAHRRSAALAAAGVLFALIAPVPADAGQTAEMARVKKVPDGDTIDVDFDFDGSIDARVRLAGIDTPENGTCGSYGAKKMLRTLVAGKKVRISSDDPDPRGLRDRLVRYVEVWRNGRWVDVTRFLLARGFGPWLPNATENSRARLYHETMEKAAARGARFFDPDRCRIGPRQRITFDIQVQWAPDLAKGVNRLNQEFIRIRNLGSYAIDLSRWTLRTGGKRTLRIPPGPKIAPGRTLTVHVGSGTQRRYHRYFGLKGPILINVQLDGSGPHKGDGVYLLDRDGDLRGYRTWPCVGSCADPTGGGLVIDAYNADAAGPYDKDNLNDEWVRLKNEGSLPVHTGNVVLENLPYIYEFPPGHWLQPGETVTIHVGTGTDTQSHRYLGSSSSAMKNDSDRVLIRTFDALVIDCESWGTETCP